jgi:DNA-binding NarL/FixJ family response regulator
MKPESLKKHRVLVVDDHPLLREGIIQLLNRDPELTVCGEASTVTAADAAVTALEPDLLVLDLRLGSDDTIEFIKSLRARFPKLRILIVTQYEETIYAERSMRAGAHGYIVKQEAVDEILTAIHTVLAGDCYVSRKIATVLFRREMMQSTAQRQGSKTTKVRNLSDRELHVFQLLGTGMTTREIARSLNLSIKTIETYRDHIKTKLDLHNSTQLIHEATQWVQQQAPASSIDIKDAAASL